MNTIQVRNQYHSPRGDIWAMVLLVVLFVLLALFGRKANGQSLGSVTVENRASTARPVIQVATIPFRQGEYRAGTAITATTPSPVQCQVESWLMPYPDGSEKCVKVHYPANLPANDIRISHGFEIGNRGSAAPFRFHPDAALALRNLWLVFFCGPKQTHWVPLLGPGIAARETIRDGDHAKTLRWFARVPNTQVWAEADLSLYSDVPYALLHVRWGVDDPRIDSYSYDRSGFTDEETETGFYLVTESSDPAKAQLQPLAPSTCVLSLDWEAPTWKWVWDKRTTNNRGQILNDRIPWGCALHAQAVITFGSSQGATAWHESPYYHDAVSDQWRVKTTAYEAWGCMPRVQKTHEHWENRDAAYIRTKLETEFAAMMGIDGTRNCPTNYAWNHQANFRIEGLWHQMDGQTGGNHGYWNWNPCVTSCHYDVPSESHYVRRALYICPWPYTGYREVDGRIFSCLDHPMTASSRGQPGGNLDRHGKGPAPSWPDWPLLYEPRSSGRLVGADGAHFATGWPHMHSTIFGDDGTRRICESLCYGPVHLGNWNLDPARRGAVGEQRNWARGLSQAARSLYVFGSDNRLVNYITDALYLHRVKPGWEETEAQYPGRVIQAIYFLRPLREGDQRVNLANHFFYRPWEICHAVGEYAIWELAGHIRPELSWFKWHAKENANAVFRYGSPRVVDETTGAVLNTFLRQGIYEPAAAVAIVDGARRQLTFAEMSDNNWTRCGGISGQCGDPPTNDGYMRLGVPNSGTGSFVAGLAGLVQDGPLGDPVLTRYTDASPGRKAPRPNDNSYVGWVDSLFKTRVGPSEEIVLGSEIIKGTHNAELRSTASSFANPGVMWCLRQDGALLQRIDIATGQPILAQPQGVPSIGNDQEVLSITSVSEGRTSFVAALLRSPKGARIVVALEQPLQLVQDWSFAMPPPSALCWVTQLQAFLVASGSGIWIVRPGDAQATKASLPAESGLLIVDLPDIQQLSTTVDGQLLLIVARDGSAHGYVWNARAKMWGGRRWTGFAPLGGWSTHGRADDALRLYHSDATTRRFVERRA